LLQQFVAWDLDETDLQTTLTYVLELAPLLIHIKLGEILPKIVEDTRYRNQVKGRYKREGGKNRGRDIEWGQS